ncbi:peptidase C14 [Aulographum hederae CBS 113979]|uniref:Peptidase C14 n=1 Tax=Aulographum hederae CBS 113979 TaxID=1176131 RepID=A0A6G1GTB9_9PEZI|nr:peptidase C14 [Aulographum hederae CBS 113979]
MSRPRPRKSLLIGINYVGSQHELRGCHADVQNVAEFLTFRGYSNSRRSQVIMRDDRYTDPDGPMWPNGHNILAAMDWLVSAPGTCCFLHYSGHGGQVRDPDGYLENDIDDTIVPVDYETRGQLASDILHRHLVTSMAPGCTLFIVFDCCHSGSAVELPYVYRSDADGNVGLMDNLKIGVELIGEAGDLLAGGFSFNKLGEARELYGGATDFFRGLKHMGEAGGDEDGLQAEDEFQSEYGSENKMVTLFSGCRDDQTSADASIAGANVGAMSWAFLETMKRQQYPTYLTTLQMTRGLLDESNYSQIPQLSMGLEMDLDQPLVI